MNWQPEKMVMYDVIKHYGGMNKAGLRSISRKGDKLILHLLDGTTKTVEPGEEIPLPGKEGENG
jgi:hypothetical protein